MAMEPSIGSLKFDLIMQKVEHTNNVCTCVCMHACIHIPE